MSKRSRRQTRTRRFDLPWWRWPAHHNANAAVEKAEKAILRGETASWWFDAHPTAPELPIHGYVVSKPGRAEYQVGDHVNVQRFDNEAERNAALAAAVFLGHMQSTSRLVEGDIVTLNGAEYRVAKATPPDPENAGAYSVSLVPTRQLVLKPYKVVP